MFHGSLFSGIGGFDLAASWMGWTNVFNCEIDPFCRAVLKKHWPYAKTIENIEQFPPTPFYVDVISGGFPCQSFSVAGKRQGTADSRYLWPAMYRVISKLKPPYVVAENVMGIISWGQGLVFDQVHLDLEAEGYQVRAFVLPAVAAGAPHVRNRVWFVGYNSRFDPCQSTGRGAARRSGTRHKAGASHPHSQGLEGAAGPGQAWQAGRPGGCPPVPSWDHWPTQSPVCLRDDGLSTRLVDITLPGWRRQSIKALGNAIVPQIALRIFDTIARHRDQILADGR